MHPLLKLRVFVDDITALLMEKNKVVAEMAKKVMKRLVTKNNLSLKSRVFVDGITAPLIKKNKEVAEMATKVMKKLKEEVEKKGLKQSVNEKGKVIASCSYSEDEMRQCSKEEGVTMADSVETQVKKLLRAGMVPARSWGNPRSGDSSYRKVKN